MNFCHWFLNCFCNVKFIKLESDLISWNLLILLLICSSLSRALRCNVSSFIWCLPVYLVNGFNDINFLLAASFIVAQKFWYVVLLLSFTSKFFFISSLIHTGIHSSFNNDLIWFNLQVLICFLLMFSHWCLI